MMNNQNKLILILLINFKIINKRIKIIFNLHLIYIHYQYYYQEINLLWDYYLHILHYILHVLYYKENKKDNLNKIQQKFKEELKEIK
jgi:hypothetical protein